jgi:hypothetical protein
MRVVHQVDGGFGISVTRSVDVDVPAALAAFTDAVRRVLAPGRGDAPAPDPPPGSPGSTGRTASRRGLVDPKGDGRSAVNVTT